MTSKVHLFGAVLMTVLVGRVAGAQMRNETPAIRRPSMQARPTPRVTANSTPANLPGRQSSQQANVIQISPSGQIVSSLGPIANSFDFDNTSGVPGLGFDFPHLAAISGALRSNPSSHFDRRGHRGDDFFVPILFGGYPYYYDDFGYAQPEQQPIQQSQPQPQIIVIQQPVPAQQGADSGADRGNDSASVSTPQPAAPVPDVGNFILVRRDGRILFASVFSVVGAQLQYVTPEGVRHTLAMADLDADATRQMNEARGTTVELHN